MTRFMAKIKSVDPKVHERLIVEQDIKPQYFSFRWLTLMLVSPKYTHFANLKVIYVASFPVSRVLIAWCPQNMGLTFIWWYSFGFFDRCLYRHGRRHKRRYPNQWFPRKYETSSEFPTNGYPPNFVSSSKSIQMIQKFIEHTVILFCTVFKNDSNTQTNLFIRFSFRSFCSSAITDLVFFNSFGYHSFHFSFLWLSVRSHASSSFRLFDGIGFSF